MTEISRLNLQPQINRQLRALIDRAEDGYRRRVVVLGALAYLGHLLGEAPPSMLGQGATAPLNLVALDVPGLYRLRMLQYPIAGPC
ncbi:hypothetical protein D3C76_1210850 [compost metagenome]